MTKLVQALVTLLKGTGVAVYVTGSLPRDVRPPYMVLNLSRAAAFEPARVTATFWTAGDSANAQRFDIMDALERLIPPQGILLLRYVYLFRDAVFLQTQPGQGEAALVGGRVNLVLRCYSPELQPVGE